MSDDEMLVVNNRFISESDQLLAGLVETLEDLIDSDDAPDAIANVVKWSTIIHTSGGKVEVFDPLGTDANKSHFFAIITRAALVGISQAMLQVSAEQ